MKILFMDDMEERHKIFNEWFMDAKGANVLYAVWTAEAAIDALRKDGPFSLIFLDHDLGQQHYVAKEPVGGPGFEPTHDKECGCEVARFILEARCPGTVVIHSYNAPAARQMEALFKAEEDEALWFPFGPAIERILKGALTIPKEVI